MKREHIFESGRRDLLVRQVGMVIFWPVGRARYEHMTRRIDPNRIATDDEVSEIAAGIIEGAWSTI